MLDASQEYIYTKANNPGMTALAAIKGEILV